MSQLHPCPSCARHVKKSETDCPFCGSAISLAGAPGRARPTQRMGRAATFAFGVATSLAACGGTPAPTGTDANTSIDSGVVPLYGGPPVDAGGDTGGPGPLYGGPPVDAGADAGGPGPMYGGPPVDAGIDTGSPAAAYGAPPP